MTDQKQYNELSARLGRLETLLQNNDAYSPPGAITLEDLDMGPGMSFDIPSYDEYINQNIQWDPQWDPNQYGLWQQQELLDNDGFSGSQSGINSILDRLYNIESFLGGNSNDTNQTDALDWSSDLADDGENGTGLVSGLPSGYEEIIMNVCIDGVASTYTMLAKP